MTADADELAAMAETIVAAEAATAGMEDVWPGLVAAIHFWHRDLFGPAVHAAEQAGIACQHHEFELAATLLRAAADTFANLADETPCTAPDDEDASEELRDLA